MSTDDRDQYAPHSIIAINLLICNGPLVGIYSLGMTETSICKFPGMMGIANQTLCSNQHKVVVFQIHKMMNCLGKGQIL